MGACKSFHKIVPELPLPLTILYADSAHSLMKDGKVSVYSCTSVAGQDVKPPSFILVSANSMSFPLAGRPDIVRASQKVGV